jgi:drug/metabolite transporter (DMT)-like permease
VLLIAAVAASVAGALCFAVGALLEQRAALQVPERGVFAPRMLLDLARRPLWVASVGVTIIGVALQVTALHFGPLALVQPILVCDLLFAVVLGAALRRSAPDRTILAGVACCAAGIAVFLAVAQPTGGNESVSLPAVIPLAVGLAAALAGCLAWARTGPRVTRALALALACGVAYGVNAFLLKLVSFSLAQGFSEPLRQWPLYALVVVAPVGYLLNQEAFQRGTLLAPVLAVITSATSLVSIAIARLWLDESFASGVGDIVTEVLALAVMTAGIVMLAYRAPAVAEQRRIGREAGLPQQRQAEAVPGTPRQAEAVPGTPRQACAGATPRSPHRAGADAVPRRPRQAVRCGASGPADGRPETGR